MKLEEYKKEALQRINPLIEASPKESMNYTCLGILEETGEVIAEIRKPLFKGNFHEKPLDIAEIKSELGDLMWYMALACKNNDIDMNELKAKDILEMSKEPNTKRERIIQICIRMGQTSGEIVEQYQLILEKNEENDNLKKKIEEQYYNIVSLCNELGISIDEVLKENIQKVNSRYNKNGKAVQNLENR